MKKFTLMSVMLLAGAGVMAIAGEEAPTTAPTPPTTAPTTQAAAPINKYCAVQGEGNPVDPNVTVIYQGKTIGFCCEDCIADFNKDPEKYMKNLK